jgi:multisubunit Na+/H+ antiporter MnhG subunit
LARFGLIARRKAMQTLRWILGLTTGVTTAGFFALVIFGDGFRRSFGASENGSLKVGVIILVLAALIASLVAPNQRLLMHGVAILVILLLTGSAWVCRESAFVGTTGLAYCALWFGYYWQAVSLRH